MYNVHIHTFIYDASMCVYVCVSGEVSERMSERTTAPTERYIR